ncbi:hypothetical protein EJP82_14560 [Paenibacillus anaericanus]|uniref:Uncharacterized protein n=1 Tax=Paenibacillus anaericanus TaxID=170367 RepID=A0A433Y8D7_9BACL|nr:hypothetical protein EJP82_14560 [Paenibacillus anaericanus]
MISWIRRKRQSVLRGH